MNILMKCMVQEAKYPIKQISSGSVVQRDLIPALKGLNERNNPAVGYATTELKQI
jgi:hypothetical protein